MRGERVGMSHAVAPGRSWYLPFAHVAPDGELAGGTPPRNLPALASEALAPLRELLADARVPKAGHNIKHDWLALRRAGVELVRSEEHTSELQSQSNLVCRLLLEKKKSL